MYLRTIRPHYGKTVPTLLWLIAWLLVSTTVGAKTLPDSVAGELRRLGIPPSSLSVHVQRVATKKPRLAFNAEQPRNPASVIKLLTSLVALEILGPAYTWKTEAWLSGNLRQGTLEGDLVLKGYGDPFLTPEKFWQLLRGLRERGLERIDGNLIVDDSHIASPTKDRGAFDGKPQRAYNALPNALSLNFQATRITVLPDLANGTVRAFAYPPLANLAFDNAVQLIDGPCTRGQRRPTMHFRRAGGGATLELRGKLATGCPEGSSSFLVMSPHQQLEGAFRALWAELGGSFDGQLLEGASPAGAELFHRLNSRPLTDILRGMNKFSNNLMSRLVFLTIGSERYEAPGTPLKARRAVQEWLVKEGIGSQDIKIDNGAGLSRDTRISASELAHLLRNAYFSPYMAEFISSMPIIGIDGTMRQRLNGTALVGRGHIKTGSIDDVNAMAGYVQDKHDRRWVVVSILNHEKAGWRTNQIQDALLEWVYAGAP